MVRVRNTNEYYVKAAQAYGSADVSAAASYGSTERPPSQPGPSGYSPQKFARDSLWKSVRGRPQPRVSLARLPRQHSLRMSSTHRTGLSREAYQVLHEEDVPPAIMDVSSPEQEEEQVGTLQFVREERDKNAASPQALPHSKLAKKLCLTCLVSSVILFLCQPVAAGCVCRPVVLLGGLWVAILMLCKGILGQRVIATPTRATLVGDVVLSVLAALVGVIAAAYLISGRVIIGSFSAFHRKGQTTALRLYILEFTALVASIPCIAGAASCVIAAAISVQAARTPKKKTPVVLYFKRWFKKDATQHTTPVEDGGPAVPHTPQHPPYCAPLTQVVSHPLERQYETSEERTVTPPSNYQSVAQESFA